MKFSSKGFFSKCDQIRGKLRIWSDLVEISFNGKLYFLRIVHNPQLFLQLLNFSPVCCFINFNEIYLFLLIINIPVCNFKSSNILYEYFSVPEELSKPSQLSKMGIFVKNI